MQALHHEYSVNMSESLQSSGFWTLTKDFKGGNRLMFSSEDASLVDNTGRRSN